MIASKLLKVFGTVLVTGGLVAAGTTVAWSSVGGSGGNSASLPLLSLPNAASSSSYNLPQLPSINLPSLPAEIRRQLQVSLLHHPPRPPFPPPRPPHHPISPYCPYPPHPGYGWNGMD